jgi:hypothetical protein
MAERWGVAAISMYAAEDDCVRRWPCPWVGVGGMDMLSCRPGGV